MPKTNSDLILKIALDNLGKFNGWNQELLDYANNQAKKYTSIKNFIPISSAKELVKYFLEDNDQKMLAELREKKIEELPIREKIKQALLIRFNLHQKEIIKYSCKFLIHPNNADLSFSSLAGSCDVIWRFAGDKSTDFNYYSKRLLLAGIYSSSIVYYLSKEDISDSELEDFISNRIENGMSINKIKSKIKEFI
jgi:ubiquinone biosynthesis protein COQ9